MTTTFPELGVGPDLVHALGKLDISEPTPIQVAAFSVLNEGQSACLTAETGTGKTLAYLLPLFTRLDLKLNATQVLIIVPTHELAIQIQRQCCDLAQHAGWAVRPILLIGGTPIDRQIEKLKKKPHIAVGSSGRIRDLIGMGKLKTKSLRTIVIDEADRMMGPENLVSIRSIIKTAMRDVQLIFASATEQTESTTAIQEMAPKLVMLRAGETPVNPNIEHLYLVCDQREKVDVLRKFIHAAAPERAMVFVHRNERADIVYQKLDHHKISVVDLHSATDKFDRKRAMDEFRAGRALVMVASDIASRGLDIKGISHVINLDVPTLSKAYLHRVGRTGRAGAAGTAVSLMTPEEARLVQRYEQELGIVMHPVSLREGRVVRSEEPAAPPSPGQPPVE